MIKTNRLFIRPLILEDYEDMLLYMSDPEVLKYEQMEAFDDNSLRKFIEDIIPTKNFFSVVFKESNEVIGHLYFGLNKPHQFKEYNIGYIFNPAYQNKGFCTEASKALVTYAFTNWDCHRVIARCNPDNIPSWRVMEKIGLFKEGHHKKRVCFKYDDLNNPIWWDELVYGISVEDWKENSG